MRNILYGELSGIMLTCFTFYSHFVNYFVGLVFMILKVGLTYSVLDRLCKFLEFCYSGTKK